MPRSDTVVREPHALSLEDNKALSLACPRGFCNDLSPHGFLMAANSVS